MHFTRRSRSLTAWIATLAILLGALAPALSHARAQGGSGTHLLQLCTVAGMKMVAVDEAPKEGDPKLFPAERCPFCSAHPDPALPPVGPAPEFVLERVSERFLPLPSRSPRPRFGWAAAPPRAPPFHA